MRSSSAGRQAGFTFAELAFGLLILVIAAAVMVNHLSINFQTTASERDRVFAYSKAQAILSEIQAYVDRGLVHAAVDLDVLDDGIVTRSTLSIQTDSLGTLVPADHVLSGNHRRGTEWVWSRRIQVQPFVGLDNRNVRYVTVTVLQRGADGVERPLADLSAVVNSAGSAFPTTQVFDLYLLAIENIPGWWVFMDSIKPFVESMITDLETRNPGLEYRTHWITKSAFGRNDTYRPYVNDASDSLATVNDVYYYPGRMPSGNASTFYYVPDNIRARINLDGVETNGYDATTNPYPYALADFFNHAMRYPDELARWQARVDEIEERERDIADALAAGVSPPPELSDMSKEPTFRLFLEDLYSDPAKYRNALIVNLHGELLPMPALRNYSDAARVTSDSTFWWMRCVTHPEELRTARNAATPTSSDPVRLRVYAYNIHTPTYAGPQLMPRPIALEVVGLDLTNGGNRLHANHQLRYMPGGVAPTPVYPASFQAAVHADDGPPPDRMCYSAEFVAPGDGTECYTRIFLFNTPVVAPQDVANRGLRNTEQAQLYQMAYVPAPCEAALDFQTQHLGSTSASLPKNTARWTLQISPQVFGDGSFKDTDGASLPPLADDVLLKVRTRIWTGATPATSGTMWPPSARNEPENLSVTYTWWADSAEDVPITERSQFNGDPRHVPYKDLTNLAGADFRNGYNWFHDNLQNGGENSASNYPGLVSAQLQNRWGGGAMFCDVPRYFELLRKGLVRSACVYTTLTGFSYYYLGIGNDIGYDAANGYPSSIPVDLTPFGSPGSDGYLDTITGARRFVRTSGAGYWWGIPWLGELFPDSVHATWYAVDGAGNPRGNLTAGTAAGRFWQATMNSVYAGSIRTAFGTALNNAHQRTASVGCTTFFNIGTSASTFHHTSTSGNGTLTGVGNELATNYGMTFPASVPVSRPFGLTWGGSTGEEWNYAPYSGAGNRYSATLYRTYLSHASGIGSGLVKLVDPGATSAAYIVVNGIDKAVDSGTSFIAKYAMLTLAHSFSEAGSTTNTLRIQQLPRVEIASPTDITELDDPATIDVQYGIEWVRWDGSQYTNTGSYAEDESLLDYVLMYSNDGGTSWFYMHDDSKAVPGERPDDPVMLYADAGAGNEVFTWGTPAARFPEGSYVLRIDCFRRGTQIHFSYHKAKIFIQR